MKCAYPVSAPFEKPKSDVRRDDRVRIEVPCGKCLPCRINKRRMWTARILLELRCHRSSSFTTVTYDDGHLPLVMAPDGGALGNLEPEHLRLFFARLRKHARFRYFAVGEYGERTLRPHYHVLFFGVNPDDALRLLRKHWPHGSIFDSREVLHEHAAYCARYSVKKWTKDGDPRLLGRVPEFARMSRRPPLGQPYVERLAAHLNTRHGAKGMAELGDVPPTVTIEGKDYPLDRTMRNLLRDAFGIPRRMQDRIGRISDIRPSDGYATMEARSWMEKERRQEVGRPKKGVF